MFTLFRQCVCRKPQGRRLAPTAYRFICMLSKALESQFGGTILVTELRFLRLRRKAKWGILGQRRPSLVAGDEEY
jgi:hypothetical protein